MSKMKILWLSNKAFSDTDKGTGGTWLQPLANALIRSGTVELANLTQGQVGSITHSEMKGITQWVVPVTKLRSNGLPASSVVKSIVEAVKVYSPDIIHIWGTENYWGLLTARNILPFPALLRMQGVKFLVGKSYTGDLSFCEKLASVGIKEMIRGSSIFQIQKAYKRWEAIEREIIVGHHHIITQSPWTIAQVRAINPVCEVYHNPPTVRKAFSKMRQWNNEHSVKKDKKIKLFCSVAYSAPYKGLHVATRALKILSSKFDNIELRIAGNHRTSGIRRDGYITWLIRENRKLGIEEKVRFLGPLKENEIIHELLGCSAFVMPSFIESYSVALIEAMTLGVPTVVSYVGGLSEMATDKKSALFFSPGDHAMCAYQLEKILTDEGLANKLSMQARKILACNDIQVITDQIIDIYKTFLNTVK